MDHGNLQVDISQRLIYYSPMVNENAAALATWNEAVRAFRLLQVATGTNADCFRVRQSENDSAAACIHIGLSSPRVVAWGY